MCDQYAIGIIRFPHGDIDNKTEWDHPLWVESYTTYSQDIFPISFATASVYTYWSAPQNQSKEPPVSYWQASPEHV